MEFVNSSAQGKRFGELVSRINECLGFIRACRIPIDEVEQFSEASFFTSHEALLLGYELAWGGVAPGEVRPWLLRMVAVNAVAQAWWVIPVLIQARSAPSFLPFSEQPGTIWSTTSLPESLRLMGFWTSYVGVGYGGVLRPFSSQGNALLFLAPVVVARAPLHEKAHSREILLTMH